MEDSARARREAIRQLAGLRSRLAAAEDTLAEAQAAMKRAEAAFDAASDRFTSAEAYLDAAREERAQARQARYAARQAYERARVVAERLGRRVREMSERLDRTSELAARLSASPRCLTTSTAPSQIQGTNWRLPGHAWWFWCRSPRRAAPSGMPAHVTGIAGRIHGTGGGPELPHRQFGRLGPLGRRNLRLGRFWHRIAG